MQHRITENKALIAKLLKEDKASVYICGDARRMPQEVKEAITEALIDEGKLSKIEAESLLQKIQKEGKYQMDVWF